ncbi:MAG: CarD family transcriptional regulator [Rhodospirillales bacterium]|nr:CarD family transcriptional regulator [Rhodospirillales bacterium]
MKTDKTQAVKAIAAKVAAAKASDKTAARAPVTKPTLVKAVATPVVAAKPAAAKAAAPVKAVAPVEVAKPVVVAKAPEIKAVDVVFDKGDFVVYPAHGVGRVVDIEAMKIAGTTIDVFVMSFEQDRMTLRVPVAKAKFSGLRKLSSRKIMDSALTTLKGRGRISRAMWNRRAQEYEAKINSGDPVSIAEVVRDLHRNAGQPDQSYSERQIYEAALDRLAREFAAVERIDKEQATEKLTLVLNAALMKQAA